MATFMSKLCWRNMRRNLTDKTFIVVTWVRHTAARHRLQEKSESDSTADVVSCRLCCLKFTEQKSNRISRRIFNVENEGIRL